MAQMDYSPVPFFTPEQSKRLQAQLPAQQAQQQPLPVAQGPVASGAPAAAPEQPASPLPRAQVPRGTASSQPQQSAPLAFPQYGKSNETQNQQTLRQTEQQGSRISRIHNPFLRTAAGIGDAILGTFAPRAEQLIPGTEGNYALHLARAQNAVKGEREVANEQSEAGLRQAEARRANAEAAEKENPEQKEPTTDIGLFLRNPEMFKAYKQASEKAAATKEPQMIRSEGTTGKIIGMIDPQGRLHSASDPDLDPQAKAIMESSLEKPPTLQEGERPLGERVQQLNQALESRYQVLHPKAALPPQYKIPDNATQKDYDRIDKALESEEKAVGTKAQQDQVNEMRRQTMAIAAQGREQKDANAIRSASFKAYSPALDSAERFNVMTKNYEDAIKNHDQQAMLSLLANHLGMTMGLQKGARLTRDIINEAKNSTPWLQGLEARFDKDGYLSGVTLTPQQMRQMLGLGSERFAQDIVKAKSEARYQGATDEGPERTPSRSTMNFYLSQTNGDLNKAKSLAAADGWSVK